MLLSVKVTPKSSSNRVRLEPEGGLTVWVTSPPADGEANEAVVKTVAKALGVAQSRVSIARGHTSRTKQVCVERLNAEDIKERLGSLE
jgi:uncharacterized protein (TIGR00251 family)